MKWLSVELSLLLLVSMVAFAGFTSLQSSDTDLTGAIAFSTIFIKDKLKSGAEVQTKLNSDFGTLRAGNIYTVKYSNGVFSVAGYNKGTKKIGTWRYSNADLNKNQISLWGAVFTFTDEGKLLQNGKAIGEIINVIPKPTTTIAPPVNTPIPTPKPPELAPCYYSDVITKACSFETLEDCRKKK